MHIKPIIVFCSALLLPAIGMAKTVIPTAEEEVAARLVCTEASEAHADKACSDWVAVSTCGLLYKDHLGDVSKFFSNEKMQSFRKQAEKQMPKTCEPIAALMLSVEILEEDLKLSTPSLSPKDRQAKWADIAKRAMGSNKPADEQFVTLAQHMIDDRAFPEMISNKDIVKFINYTQETIDKKLGKLVKEDENVQKSYDFLEALEGVAPSLITSSSALTLFMHELETGKQLSARSRIALIDFAKLSKESKERLVPKIQSNALVLFGQDDFKSSVCFKDVAVSPSIEHQIKIFDTIQNAAPEVAWVILRSETSIRILACDYDKVFQTYTALYQKSHTNTEATKYTDDLITYLEQHEDEDAVLALGKALGQLSGDPLQAFLSRYGLRITNLMMRYAKYEFDHKANDKAASIMEDVIRYRPVNENGVAHNLYGRILDALNRGTQARQQYAMVMDNNDMNAAERDLAYYLTVVSLRKEKKTAEADAMQAQFHEKYPLSEWYPRL